MPRTSRSLRCTRCGEPTRVIKSRTRDRELPGGGTVSVTVRKRICQTCGLVFLTEERPLGADFRDKLP